MSFELNYCISNLSDIISNKQDKSKEVDINFSWSVSPELFSVYSPQVQRLS